MLFNLFKSTSWVSVSIDSMNEELPSREEVLDLRHIEGPLRDLALPLLLQLMANALLQNLQLLLGTLRVQRRDVTDTADSEQNCLMLDQRRLGTEAGNHADPLAATKCLQGLVLNITILHYDPQFLLKS